jgi:hypothetical protein
LHGTIVISLASKKKEIYMTAKQTSLFAFVIVCGVIMAACQSPLQTSSPTTESSSVPTVVESTSEIGTKKVSVTRTYQSPGGPEQVAFSVTVDESGIITDAQTQVLGKSPTTIMRQESFAKEMPIALKGKKLSDLEKVDRIGGSSLTTGAFNAALSEMKAQL